jgi:hypothetical protein
MTIAYLARVLGPAGPEQWCRIFETALGGDIAASRPGEGLGPQDRCRMWIARTGRWGATRSPQIEFYPRCCSHLLKMRVACTRI